MTEELVACWLRFSLLGRDPEKPDLCYDQPGSPPHNVFTNILMKGRNCSLQIKREPPKLPKSFTISTTH
jgi:hypothetical protein